MFGHINQFFFLSRWTRGLGLTAALLSVGLMGSAAAQDTAQRKFASFAAELLAGIIHEFGGRDGGVKPTAWKAVALVTD